MNVLLLTPSWGTNRAGARRFNRPWPPLDLLTSAALLREHGHRPVLLDARARRLPPESIRKEALAADLVLLQSTPLDRWQCPNLDWEKLLSVVELLPREKTFLAGAHGTIHPEFMLKSLGVKALVTGEPEAPLLQLAEAGGQPEGVPGVLRLLDGRLTGEAERPPLDLGELPPPAYDMVDLNNYQYQLLGPRLALLETSRGCPYSCIFCLKSMYGPGVRRKPPDKVLLEIEETVGRRKAASVYFIDLEFTLRRADTEALCRSLIASGLKFRWCCQTRADTVDPDLLALMKQSGCRLVHFGVETGSPRLLESIGKRISLEQITGAVKSCRRLGISTACFFLFGLPGESEADRRATMRFARKLNPTYASFHAAAPYRGSEMGLKSHPALLEPFPACLEEHSLDELGSQARRAFLSFYLRPGYVAAGLREGNMRDKINRLKLFWEFIR